MYQVCFSVSVQVVTVSWVNEAKEMRQTVSWLTLCDSLVVWAKGLHVTRVLSRVTIVVQFCDMRGAYINLDYLLIISDQIVASEEFVLSPTHDSLIAVPQTLDPNKPIYGNSESILVMYIINQATISFQLFLQH